MAMASGTRGNPLTDSDAAIAALQGAWRVRWSDSPPPSNGALGPIRGAALQVVDVPSRTYTNELALVGGLLEVKLRASFAPKLDGDYGGATALRVAFESIAISILGLGLPPIAFPEGTERTWLLTYTDDDTRLVRAGVDGGRSTARDLGLLDRSEGEKADSYLFVLTRDRAEEAARAAGGGGWRSPLALAERRRELKEALLRECAGQRLGADTNAAGVERIGQLMEQLGALNPTADPASSPKLCATWEIMWTTESELLALTSNGFLGLPCKSAYQTIARRRGAADGSTAWAYTLDNIIDFDGGSLRVGSTCEPAARGSRVDFRFSSCSAKWKALALPLPPVGAGFFEVLYLDDSLRVCKDSRGDLQICVRRECP